MIINKFVYNSIPKETAPSGYRVYLTEDGEKLPSVTTVIGATNSEEDKAGLKKWQEWVGDVKAEQIRNEAANVGTLMHKRLEWYVNGIEKRVGSNLIHQQAAKMARTIIDNGLVNVNEIWGSEISLYFPGLYAGTTDLVGLWKNRPAIMDFKQSNKLKKAEFIEGYKMQICAYSLAHDELYGTNIKTGVIFISTRACEYQEFVVEGREFDKYMDKWLHRLEIFYNTIDK